MVLVNAELTCIFVAMSVVAWLRYPVEPDNHRLAMGRFFYPCGAVCGCILVVTRIHQPLAPGDLAWVLGISVVVVGMAARALAEVRHYRRRRLARSSKWPLKR